MFKWIIPVKVNGFKTKYVFQIFKQLSIEEREYYKVLTDPHYKVMIDVGSAIGTISDYFLRQSSDRMVYCFEPQEEFVRFSEKHLGIKVNQVALSDEVGIKDFYTNKRFDQEGSLKGEGKIRQRVIVKRLDDYQFDRVDLIKYDVEGSDYEAINGSLRTIEKHKPDILFEDWGIGLYEKIIQILPGYKIKKLCLVNGSDGSKFNYFAEPNVKEN
jgi:FkbM family methyltransferase